MTLERFKLLCRSWRTHTRNTHIWGIGIQCTATRKGYCTIYLNYGKRCREFSGWLFWKKS